MIRLINATRTTELNKLNCEFTSLAARDIV